jgi:hypothetical protein
MGRVAATAPNCPFCAQDLAGSPVIAHYRAYFSEEYTNLKGRISRSLAQVNGTHGGESAAAFERAVRVAVERRQFWARFCEVPEITVDTAAVARDWRAAREAVAAVLNAKLAAPLERSRPTRPAGQRSPPSTTRSSRRTRRSAWSRSRQRATQRPSRPICCA